jgi:hypothetical protein
MKFKLFIVVFILVLGVSSISCNGTQEQAEQEESVPVMDLAQVRQAIEETNVKFGEAVRLGDAAAIAGLYSEDARLLPPNSEMIEGREGIETFWGGGLQMGIKDAILTTVEVFGRME